MTFFIVANTFVKIDPLALEDCASVSNAKDSVCQSSKQKGVGVIGAPKEIACCIEDLGSALQDKVILAPAESSHQLVLHAKQSEAMSGDQKVLLKGHSSQYVKLNVGGRLYYTTIGTLTKHNDTMLSAMFSGRMEVLTDSEGWILIDRCGNHFGIILNFLRDGSVPLPETNKEIAELLAESKYYCITELALSCERALYAHIEPKPICRIPLITSQKEEQLLISASSKPAVILVVQRQNNKYSYTSTSDDNLLKNIELFDKLSLRFNERILFIKDVIGPSEICCWSFYGHGKKVAEVCCTSIVYATDRKHTKVEFPEARIYEETLQVLLYENRNAPDQDLMQATSSVRVGGVSGTSMHQYTSDEEEERTGLARLRSNKRNNPT
ncbi:BTB/POZ domain-containing adapter for CUL3-mediated RhoA degradation protein 3 [Drosophila miranda]|uniref:BTB/POZ domain-containing adapter for CUL3-mediated RhoA degradation protein 3 n=1 Tax=Drosophila persimilis TaxID=7234 RepID=UPI000F08CA3A|nr:BTB/POZ domain-containing adapter for CUL3-mediated RhoA degradation protein 3 [Drosophila persimilis]XP_033246440.1 BTB/POZ domain-containing adapter for CUL3-mediated RhoA degradation protein 3 [Drosophila miranda]